MYSVISRDLAALQPGPNQQSGRSSARRWLCASSSWHRFLPTTARPGLCSLNYREIRAALLPSELYASSSPAAAHGILAVQAYIQKRNADIGNYSKKKNRRRWSCARLSLTDVVLLLHSNKWAPDKTTGNLLQHLKCS